MPDVVDRIWAIDERSFELFQASAADARPAKSGLSALIDTDAIRAFFRQRFRRQAANDAPIAEFLGNDGIARIPIRGVLFKEDDLFGNPGTASIRRQVELAGASPEVRAILLMVDSPGGSAKGIDDLARAVADAAEKKPVVAYIEDIGASGAFYVASQASRIVANPSAVVGSIGTFVVLTDATKFFEDQGIKFVVVKSGKFKGAGAVGTPIDEEVVAEFQRLVDSMNALFLDAVRRGRGMGPEELAAVADGRVLVGDAAREAGLVDTIGSERQALELLTELASRKGDLQMSNDGEKVQESLPATAPLPAAATLQELKAEFPDSDAAFREDCVLKGLTIEEARKAWMEVLRQSLADARQQLEERAALERSSPRLKYVGGASVSMPEREPIDHGCARERWKALVAAKRKEGKDPETAVREVNRENPGLREQMLAEVNGARVANA